MLGVLEPVTGDVGVATGAAGVGATGAAGVGATGAGLPSTTICSDCDNEPIAPGVGKVGLASLFTRSLIVPPLSVSAAVLKYSRSVDESPEATVYKKLSTSCASLPYPVKSAKVPAALVFNFNCGVPVTLTDSEKRTWIVTVWPSFQV